MRQMLIKSLAIACLLCAPVAAHENHSPRERGAAVTASVDAKRIVARPAPHPLVDQTGRSVRLDEILARNPVTIISFVYVNCGSQCPVAVDAVTTAQERLVTEGITVQNVSITLDPENDRPEILASKASGEWKAERSHLFLTGEPARVRSAIASLGIPPNAKEAHSEPYLVRTTAGMTFDVLGNGATPDDLVRHIRDALKRGRP